MTNTSDLRLLNLNRDLRDLAPPSGTITFVFTDIEGSTALWERDEIAMRAALARHDVLVCDALTTYSGYVFKSTGDGFCAAFATAADAVSAAIAAQQALQGEPWVDIEPLHVRMALITGTAELRDGDYFGAIVNRGSRLVGLARSREVLLCASTAELVRDGLGSDVALRDCGEHRMRGVSRPIRVFELSIRSLTHDPKASADRGNARMSDSSNLTLPGLAADWPPERSGMDESDGQSWRVGRCVALVSTYGGGTSSDERWDSPVPQFSRQMEH